MKLLACLITTALFAGSATAALGVSISIGDPGYYGQINIGDAPRPRMIYRDPVIIERYEVSEPLYLRVRPGHTRNWKNHCREYKACGRPVYFVRDDWYQNEYAPHYRKQHGRHDKHRDDRGRDHGYGGDRRN